MVDTVSRPFMTLRIDHHGELPAGPVLMAANHRSVVDVVVALVCCRRLGRPTRFIVKQSFFRTPGLGLVLRSIGCIEGGRGSGAGAVAIAEIERGVSCAIMPEGAVRTMEPGHILAPLLPGVADIWCGTGCALVAVGIAGAGDVWPDGHRFPRRPRRRRDRPVVHVRVAAPVHPGEEPCTLERVARLMEENCALSEAERHPER